MAGKLVLCRHGQSDWNLKNLFTGWQDVDLTEQGNDEAIAAGKLLSELGYEFDIAYTSVLKRAIRTLWHVLDQMDLMWIPVERDWRLNERHYGALQGLNKAETAAKYGDEQVHIWRRSYDIPPPPLEDDDDRHPKHDPRYAGIDGLPGAESLKLTLERVLPCWENVIAPDLRAGKNVLIASHGNSLRALLVGASIAKSLAFAWNVPAIGVHHMEGHLLASMLSDNPPKYPFIALLVSGGHTLLLACHGLGQYELLGESLDDAAGEAFDKVAKMLELPYPGGPQVARLALDGDSSRFRFPRPMTDRPGLDFSFSGLKTYTMNTLHDITNPTIQDKSDIALAFQTAVVDTIRIKCQRAIQQTGLSRLVLAGGVSANLALRDKLKVLGSKHHVEIYYPELKLCTDNGAMIAYAGLQRLRQNHTEDLSITVRPRWPMTELN